MIALLLLVATGIVWWYFGKRLSKRIFEKKGNKLISAIGGILGGFLVSFVFLIVGSMFYGLSSSGGTKNVESSATKNSDSLKVIPKEKSEGSAPVLNTLPSNEIPDEIKKSEDVSTKVIEGLEIKPAEFASRLNQNFRKLELPYKLKVKIEEGEVYNVFNFMFDSYNGILGSVNKKTGELVTVTLMTSGDGTTISGMRVITIVSAVFSAVMGENTMQTGEPGKIVLSLIKDENSTKNEGSQVILNGLKYSLIKTGDMGNVFVVESIQ